MLKRTKEVLGWIKQAQLEVVESKGTPGNTMEMQLRAANGATKWFLFHTIGEHPRAERRAVERFAEENRPPQTALSEAFSHARPPRHTSPAFARAEIATALSLNHAAEAAQREQTMNQPAKTPLVAVNPASPKPTAKPITKINQVQFFRLAEWCRANVKPGSEETYEMIAKRAREALGFDLSHASIPTALEAVGVELAAGRMRAGTPKREQTRQHHLMLARRLLEVFDKLGMEKPEDLVAFVKGEGE